MRWVAALESLLKRAVEGIVCWWVLLRARLPGGSRYQPEVERCLQMKKGTRFRLSHGRVQLLEDEDFT